MIGATKNWHGNRATEQKTTTEQTSKNTETGTKLRATCKKPPGYV